MSGLSGYLSYAEQKDIGDITITITKAEIEDVGQGDKAESKPVLSFKETRKKLVLNKSRLNQLAEVIGPKADPVGKVITVGPGQVAVNGRTFDMVVISAPSE